MYSADFLIFRRISENRLNTSENGKTQLFNSGLPLYIFFLRKSVRPETVWLLIFF